MATGYTAKIREGNVSFEEFALGCARAFSACIMMRNAPRDAPIPDKVEPSSYSKDRLEAAKEELAELQAMPEEAAALRARKDYDAALTSCQDHIKKAEELRVKYQKLLDQAIAYVPPSSEHEKYKQFMIQQLSDSMKWDCDSDYYIRQLMELKLMSGKEWKERQIEDAEHDVRYYGEEYKEEVQRAESRTKWIQQLKQSLGPGIPDDESGYVYWWPGDCKPAQLPKGCQWWDATMKRWELEESEPPRWEAFKDFRRRWPNKGNV